MARFEGGSNRYEAQLLPTKDALTALKSDVTFESAIQELCDNALDAWHRTSNRNPPAKINIRPSHHGDTTELIIRDNAGGVPRDQAAMLFGIGRTAKDANGGTIGTFGVGAKKSLVNLGVPFRITSRAEDEEVGWTYKITKDWFKREQDWSVPVDDSADLPPGTTEIRILDLNYDWTEQRATSLRSALSEAYNIYLSKEMQNIRGKSYDLTISVDDVEVKPDGVPKWSYTPFDDLHPRRYETITVTGGDLQAPITVYLTIGLLEKKDPDVAGTDIYCQGRKVASALQNQTGGYGTGAQYLPGFKSRHERLKVIVELEAHSNGQQLPWDTQKSSIDRHNPIMQGTNSSRGVYNWLRRAVKPYFEADADQVPSAFIEPYGKTSSYTVNNGRPVCHDFENRERIVAGYRPTKDYPQINNLLQRVKSQTTLKVFTNKLLDDWQLPAFNHQLTTEVSDPGNTLRQLETPLPDDAVEDPYETAGRINELARLHMENGIFAPKQLPEWQKSLYIDFFEQHTDDRTGFESPVPADVPAKLSDLTNTNDRPGKAPDEQLEMYSQQTAPCEASEEELAEIFLVFGGETDAERGEKILDTTRATLCSQFDLDADAGDDILWEHVRHGLQQALSETE